MGGLTLWIENFNTALEELRQVEESVSWSRPSADTDKLYMSLGGGDMLEVGHPSPPDHDHDPRQAGHPVLHLVQWLQVDVLLWMISCDKSLLTRTESSAMMESWTVWWRVCTGTGRITTSSSEASPTTRTGLVVRSGNTTLL